MKHNNTKKKKSFDWRRKKKYKNILGIISYSRKILWYEFFFSRWKQYSKKLFPPPVDLHSVKPRLFTYNFVLCIKFLFFIFSYSAWDFLAFHWKSNRRNPFPSCSFFPLHTHTWQRTKGKCWWEELSENALSFYISRLMLRCLDIFIFFFSGF